MAKLLKLRRGTTTQHGSFTGAEGEVTIDTTKDTAVVHDGAQVGGRPLAREDMTNVSSASIAGRLGTDSLSVGMIGAGTLPSDVKIADANVSGNLTIESADIVDGTIVDADINASADIANSKLADSGVSAGSVGSSTAIPIITVNAKGIVTATSTTAIDSTTIANGSASVAVTNNGPITSNANHDFTSGIDVTGNITVSGTVDGRDVAADGALLDGITNTSTIGEVKSTAVLADGVTATTQAASDNSTKVATTAYVTTGIANAQAFPSGTVMLFQQTNAPTGWTKVTSGVNNKSLRVVSGTVGSGGNVAFTTAFGSRGITANAANTTQGGNISVANTTAGGNVNISSVSTSGNVNSHTLSSNEMPSHHHNMRGNQNSNSYHSVNQAGGNHPGGGAGPYINAGRRYTSYNASDLGRTQDTGGNGGHSHGFSGSSHSHNGSLSGTAHNHNASFTGSAHNHSISVDNLDMQVEYLDVILASKD